MPADPAHQANCRSEEPLHIAPLHIAGGGELAREGAAEGVRGVEDGAAPEGSWQGWPGVEGVRAQELALHAVHHERRVPVSSLVRQSLFLGAMFACLSRH